MLVAIHPPVSLRIVAIDTAKHVRVRSEACTAPRARYFNCAQLSARIAFVGEYGLEAALPVDEILLADRFDDADVFALPRVLFENDITERGTPQLILSI